MTDELETPTTEQTDTSSTAVAEQAADSHTHEDAPEENGEKKPEKLHQAVEIKDIGPCKKHVKVTVERADIDERLDERYKELVGDSVIPGFRPGKAPRNIVIRKFKKDVTERVRADVLMASLEQLADDFDVAPISPPDIDPGKLEIPDQGPFIYEFDVEVRPSFDLPNYKGLKLKRPMKTFTDEDVAEEEKRILSRFGELIPKEGTVERGDYIAADMTTKFSDVVIGAAKDITIRVDDTVAFKDGVAQKFGEQVLGSRAGETKMVEVLMTDAVANEALKGKTTEATLEIKAVKRMQLPELTEEFLHQNFFVKTQDQFREWINVLLQRRLEYTQRRSAREQVLQHIAESATWELPQDLLQRQARQAMSRRILEMREAGLGDEEIRTRIRVLERDVLQTTALSLKEHFVLQKIAEVEKIEVDQTDIDEEIESLAEQSKESPRRVRAQLEKEDLLESLAAQIIERKALDLILNTAEYEDVSLEKEASIASVEEQAVPGEMKDPTQAPPAEAKTEETPTE